MSARRTSLSFPLGIVSVLLLFDCSSPERTFDQGPSSGTGGVAPTGGTTAVAGSTPKGGSTSAGAPPTSGTTAIAGTTPKGGSTSAGVPPTGGTTAVAGIGPQGGSTSAGASTAGGTAGIGGSTQSGGTPGTSGAPVQGGTAGSAGMAVTGGTVATGGAPPRDCTSSPQCDDGNACNGVETCSAEGTCVAGPLPAACSGMDATHCRCAPGVGGTGCQVQGNDVDGDGLKTRLCSADPGLDCDDSIVTITTNACKGCSTLPGAPGGVCGSCGSSTWVCSGTDGVVCTTPTPAPLQCITGTIQVCTAGEWQTQTTCSGTTPVCIVEASAPKCAACATAGVTRCKSGVTNVVQACATDRMSWTDLTCSAPNNLCVYVSPNYLCGLCQPGSTQCQPGVSNVAQTCNGTGTAWDNTVCGSSSSCIYSSSASAYMCADLLPGSLQNGIEFDTAHPEHRFRYEGPNSIGVQPFLDLASGFRLT